MKRNFLKPFFGFASFFVVFFLSCTRIFAEGGSSGFDTGTIDPPSSWLPGLNPGGLFQVGGLDFITKNGASFVVSLLFFLVIVLSLIYLIIGAITLMMNGGNKEGTAKARGTITYALIGLVIGISSIIILNVIEQILGVSLGAGS